MPFFSQCLKPCSRPSAWHIVDASFTGCINSLLSRPSFPCSAAASPGPPLFPSKLQRWAPPATLPALCQFLRFHLWMDFTAAADRRTPTSSLLALNTSFQVFLWFLFLACYNLPMVKVFETTSLPLFLNTLSLNITSFFLGKKKVQSPSISKSRFFLKMQESRSFAYRRLCALMWRLPTRACISLAALLLCFQKRSFRSERSSCEQSRRYVAQVVSPGLLYSSLM